MKFYFVLIILFFIITICSANEYNIPEAKVPYYMCHLFPTVNEAVFPYDIRINISLSKISGTLLYSIDSHGHQLIVSLHDAKSPTLALEFNSQQFYFSLSKLCGCGRCLYSSFELRIQLRNDMYIQCNNGDVKAMVIDQTAKINEGYPIPFDETEISNKSKNKAYLCLVNTPQFEGIYPNKDQLSGCIFRALYNNNHIEFSELSNKIGRNCTKVCTSDICNGGQCYETYQANPVCNCTETLLNGNFCNISLLSINKVSTTQNFIFEAIKISWNSIYSQLMQLKSKFVEILLNVDGKDLILEYKLLTGLNVTTRCLLSTRDILNNGSILCMYFNERSIDVKFKTEGQWTQTVIPTSRDLRKEIFDTIKLTSKKSEMEFAYKISQRDFTWMKLQILDFEDDRSTTFTDKSIEEKGIDIPKDVINSTPDVIGKDHDKSEDYQYLKNENFKYKIVIYILSVILGLSIIIIVIIIIKKKPFQLEK